MQEKEEGRGKSKHQIKNPQISRQHEHQNTNTHTIRGGSIHGLVWVQYLYCAGPKEVVLVSCSAPSDTAKFSLESSFDF